MTFSIRIMRAKCDLEDLAPVILELKNANYYPLVKKVREFFLDTFGDGTSAEFENQSKARDALYLRAMYSYRRRVALRYYPRPYEIGENGEPIAGDLFLSPKSRGLLYLLLLEPGLETESRTGTAAESTQKQLEIGYMGDKDEISSLSDFCTLVTSFLNNGNHPVSWAAPAAINPGFESIRQAKELKFSRASAISKEDIGLAKQLRDKNVRDIAAYMRRAGGVFTTSLHSDMAKFESADAIVEQLHRSKLLSKEYVISCRQKQIQTNRFDSLEQLKEMAQGGLRCSCGRPIDEEKCDEALAPTKALQKMLDKSYWMTACLVDALRAFEIRDKQILVNLIEGSDEIDTIVGIENMLLMFELKDKEFSLGDAYKFGARIGIFRPDYAIIVSTYGIAADVKKHFEQVFPTTKGRREPDEESKPTIVYVDSLGSLIQSLDKIISEVRSRRALPILTFFEQLINAELPLAKILAPRIGLDIR